jgi:hypothetical protein
MKSFTDRLYSLLAIGWRPRVDTHLFRQRDDDGVYRDKIGWTVDVWWHSLTGNYLDGTLEPAPKGQYHITGNTGYTPEEALEYTENYIAKLMERGNE